MYGLGRRRPNLPDHLDKRVYSIVERIVDEQNAICWGVDCAHVARYLDKNYEQYLDESSQSYKTLYRLVYALRQTDNNLVYEALNEAYAWIDSYEEASRDRQAPTRPGYAARVTGDGVGEAGALP